MLKQVGLAYVVIIYLIIAYNISTVEIYVDSFNDGEASCTYLAKCKCVECKEDYTCGEVVKNNLDVSKCCNKQCCSEYIKESYSCEEVLCRSNPDSSYVSDTNCYMVNATCKCDKCIKNVTETCSVRYRYCWNPTITYHINIGLPKKKTFVCGDNYECMSDIKKKYNVGKSYILWKVHDEAYFDSDVFEDILSNIMRILFILFNVFKDILSNIMRTLFILFPILIFFYDTYKC